MSKCAICIERLLTKSDGVEVRGHAGAASKLFGKECKSDSRLCKKTCYKRLRCFEVSGIKFQEGHFQLLNNRKIRVKEVPADWFVVVSRKSMLQAVRLYGSLPMVLLSTMFTSGLARK